VRRRRRRMRRRRRANYKCVVNKNPYVKSSQSKGWVYTELAQLFASILIS